MSTWYLSTMEGFLHYCALDRLALSALALHIPQRTKRTSVAR